MAYDITFEGGTNGATVSTGSAIASITGAPVYQTATFSEGAVSMLVNVASGTACIRTIQVTPTTHTLAFDFRRDGSIVGDTRFLSYGNLGNSTTVTNLKYKAATNLIAITNASTTDVISTSNAVPNATWTRIECQFDYTSSSAPIITMRYYANKDDAIASYTQEITWTLTGNANVFDRHNFGAIGAAAGSRAMSFDNIRCRDGLAWIGPLSTTTPIIGSETWAMVITEASSIKAFVGTTDTAAVTISETTATQAGVNTTDTASLTVNESRAVTAGVFGTDSAALSIVESTGTTVGLARTDTGAITITEGSSVLAKLAGTDTSSISITETTATKASLSTTDTSGLSIAETNGTTVLVTRTDTGALAISEAVSIKALLNAVDTGAIQISESTNTWVYLTDDDESAITISEVTNLVGPTHQMLRMQWDGEWIEGLLQIYWDGEWHPVTINFRKDNTWS